jgi:hypothetical protein
MNENDCIIFDNEYDPISDLPKGTIIRIVDFYNDPTNHYKKNIGKLFLCVNPRGLNTKIFMIRIDDGEDWHNEERMTEKIMYKIIKYGCN